MKPPNLKRPGVFVGVAGILIGVFAIAAPFLPGKLAFLALGVLIIGFGLLQNLAGFGLRNDEAALSWFSRGGASILTGLLLLLMPSLTFAGLAVFLGLSWIVGGLSSVVAALRRIGDVDWNWSLLDGLVNIIFGVAIALQRPVEGITSVGLFVGLKCLSAGWSCLFSASPTTKSTDDSVGRHPDDRLGLPPHPYFGELTKQLEQEEAIRTRSDRGWCWLFLFTFFVIHVSRMDVDWTFVGLLSPIGAVAGDAALSIVLAYGLVAPISVLWGSLTRGIERRGWNWFLSNVDHNTHFGFRSNPLRWWLSHRLRIAVRRSQARGSATGALGWGLRTGLPAAAILMAMTPLWGVSWFFNTETWVAGAWDAYAEERTDSWREQMVVAVKKEYGDAESPEFFRVAPEGVAGAKDFSFVVIGDTGEGDASQHVLRDQLIAVGEKPETKFLVVSSDVIYPSGAMKDYEPKFYLPFKGFRKPIYAVPGNHDWYDGLDSFIANFFEPKAARAALRARRNAELQMTTTTEARIDGLIREAERLRGEYGIEAARQKAPYFEMHSELFSLVVIDTGVKRRIDGDQMRWLEAALVRAGDRFKMAIIGHPLYAGGKYQGADDKEFAEIHALLKKYKVEVAMAGDTHDFEFYREPAEGGGAMHHFVNGGGGAYLSIGTALDWPKNPPVEECGCYPRADQLTTRLDAYTPAWRQPLWWWVKRFGAWPSSVEAMAAAFDYDRAPFFQSFMEVRVEGSTNKVRLYLYNAHGRLRWRDLYLQGGRIPGDGKPEDLVEFSYPLRAAPK